MYTVHRALLLVGLAAALVAADHEAGHAAPSCKKFSEIYSGGKELCENMWDGAFTYTPDDKTTGNNEENSAYTMWWMDGPNPNMVSPFSLPRSLALSLFLSLSLSLSLSLPLSLPPSLPLSLSLSPCERSRSRN